MIVGLIQILQKVNLLCQVVVTQAVIPKKWAEKEKKITLIAVEAVPQAQSQNNLIIKARLAQIKIKTCLATNPLIVLFKTYQPHQALKIVHQ